MLKRIFLPTALLIIGAFLLVGCIYVPNFGHGLDQRVGRTGQEVIVLDPEVPEPDAPRHRFRIGQTTRAQVLSELRSPEFASRDGRSLLYPQSRRDGYLVFPICFALAPDGVATPAFFASAPDDRPYLIRLNFNTEGFLISTTTDNRDYAALSSDWSLIDGTGWYHTSPNDRWPPPLSR